MPEIQAKIVHEFKFEPSPDGRFFLMHIRDPDGKTARFAIPMLLAAKWVGLQIDALTKAGLSKPKREPGKIIPKDQFHLTTPIEVSLSQQESEPTVVMDYRVGALGFVVDRGSLTHVLSQLLTRFPVGSPDQKH